MEHCLCIETLKGIVIVAGYSHPPIAYIFSAAAKFGKVYGIIGGLHGNKPETLKGFRMICAPHCTRYHKEITSLYSDSYVEGGAGRVIEIEE